MPYEITQVVPQTDGSLRCGPLIFRREDSGGCENWQVALPKDLEGMSSFSIKNYGGQPHNEDSFSGWRVVGGGPYRSAGGWTSRNEAILGATPWLLAYYVQQGKELAATVARQLEALRRFIGDIDPQAGA